MHDVWQVLGWAGFGFLVTFAVFAAWLAAHIVFDLLWRERHPVTRCARCGLLEGYVRDLKQQRDQLRQQAYGHDDTVIREYERRDFS